MRIECPSCSQANNLNLLRTIICAKCKEPLSGHKYSKSGKPMLSAISAVILSVIGYKAIDSNFWEEGRYPVATEYAIIDSCVNADKRPLPTPVYDAKKNTCVCLLEKTMVTLPYNEYENEKALLFSLFNKSLEECKKDEPL
jgi:hypothetical protein